MAMGFYQWFTDPHTNIYSNIVITAHTLLSISEKLLVPH